MRTTVRNIALITLILVGASCTKFRKLQKSTDWKEKYEAALAYYEDKDYYRSSVLLEEILPIIRGTEEAEKANFIYAYTYFYQNQHILSAHYFKTFTEIYGRSEYVEEAAYMHAYSLYMQSPQASLDQTSTYEAIAALQIFLNKYPFSKYAEKAEGLIDELQIKLETKAYDNAKLYFQLRRYKAALIAFDNFARDYPDSKYNPEIAFLAVQTAFDLAEVSIPTKKEERYRNTVDRYERMVDRYPDSPYLRQAEEFYTKSLKQLTIFADQNNQNQ
ncbi:outer membrane protein assembly factor BamD [Marinoscillum sp.]|uniref:outer membrane protein assembly factor BamD n=1 Tax=Marinoscillum sp. TaxID=2024838 RepID=UPI003BABDF20